MFKDWKIESKRYDEIILSCPASDDEVEFVVITELDADDWAVYNFYVDMGMVEDCDEYEIEIDPEHSAQEIIIDCVMENTEYFTNNEHDFNEYDIKDIALKDAEKYTDVDLSEYYESVPIGELQDWIDDQYYLDIDMSDLVNRIVEFCQGEINKDKTELFCWFMSVKLTDEDIKLIKDLDIVW